MDAPSSSSSSSSSSMVILSHAATSLTSTLLPYLLNLPSLSLSGIHTYIHPDSLPSQPQPQPQPSIAIRRPSDKTRSKIPNPNFDESKAQLFRLRLSDSHLPSRLFFTYFLFSFLLSSLSLSNLSLSLSSSYNHSTSFPFFISFLTLSYLLFSLLSLSLSLSLHPLSLLAASLSFLFPLRFFDFPPSLTSLYTTSCICAFFSFIIFTPATRTARAFWLGTDQLRWNLSVVSCGSLIRIVLYATVLLNIAAPLLWFHPVLELIGAECLLKRYRVWILTASAVVQVVAVRPNLQLYLNESVLCWYQRLHSSRVPDLDYGRAKVFLHNHYICLVLMQLFVPPVVVVILIGVSQMRGNLFSGVLFVDGLGGYSDLVKEFALFFAWWVVFVSGVLVVGTLALYRCRVLLVS